MRVQQTTDTSFHITYFLYTIKYTITINISAVHLFSITLLEAMAERHSYEKVKAQNSL